MMISVCVTWLFFDWLKESLFQVTAAQVAWDFVRFFACPAAVAFGVTEHKFRHESESVRRTQRRSILRFYKALLEADLPILKNYLAQTTGEIMPMPLAHLPISISLSDLTMCHEENQFMADRLSQQLILRSQFVDKAVFGEIDRKSVEKYCAFTEKSLELLAKMLG